MTDQIQVDATAENAALIEKVQLAASKRWEIGQCAMSAMNGMLSAGYNPKDEDFVGQAIALGVAMSEEIGKEVIKPKYNPDQSALGIAS